MNDLNDLLKLSPPMLMSVALVCLGKVMKTIPHIPNWCIPVVLPLVGAATYSVIGPAVPIEWMQKLAYPYEAYGMVGFICGALSVWGHQVVTQFLGRNGNGETTNETKPVG